MTHATDAAEYILSAKKYFVVNHCAGKGVSKSSALLTDKQYSVYETTEVGDCRHHVADICRKDPNAWIIVCGGDGTISEAVGGIMDAGANETAVFSAIGTGSGNDFVRFMNKTAEGGVIHTIDVVEANDKYSVNMINIGFDCDTVVETEKIRKLPLAGGSFGYILGVAKALIKKKTFVADLTLHGVDGTDNDEKFEGEVLLTAIAECPYCGGGFNAVPPARPTDGLVDLLIVKNITRLNFIKLVSYYRAGTHFTETGAVEERFSHILTHKRCRGFTLNGLSQMCVDGEVSKTSSLAAKVIDRALRYIVPDESLLALVK